MKSSVMLHLLLVIFIFITTASASFKQTDSVINKVKWEDTKLFEDVNSQRYELPFPLLYKIKWDAKIVGGTSIQRYEFPSPLSNDIKENANIVGDTNTQRYKLPSNKKNAKIVEGSSTQKYELPSPVTNEIKEDAKIVGDTKTQRYELTPPVTNKKKWNVKIVGNENAQRYQKPSPSTNKKKWDAKIVGGTNAQRYEFPSLVSYQTIKGEHLCGGSILTQYWVLTAAHCLIVHRPYETRVVAGMLNQKEVHPDIQIVEVYEQIIHPNYPGGTEAAPNDIGLIHLAWALRWTYAVFPIGLPYENEESFGYAWTAGWGYLSSSLPVVSTRMQKTEMLLISYNQCANDLISLVGSIGPLNQNMVCGRGAYTGTESICNGDSGGPLLQNGRVIGVTSWTLEPCGYQNVPSVYTKVSRYIQFIRYYVPGV